MTENTEIQEACVISVNDTHLLMYMHSYALIMASNTTVLAEPASFKHSVIIASGGFNQVLIENKQMISLYSTGINRNLTHEFPNYTAPFWNSVGIQVLAVTQYTISFCQAEVAYRIRKLLSMFRLKFSST